MTVALILITGLVLDGGLTLAARERALYEAQQAAAPAPRPSTWPRTGRTAPWSSIQPRPPRQASAYLAATGSTKAACK